MYSLFSLISSCSLSSYLWFCFFSFWLLLPLLLLISYTLSPRASPTVPVDIESAKDHTRSKLFLWEEQIINKRMRLITGFKLNSYLTPLPPIKQKTSQFCKPVIIICDTNLQVSIVVFFYKYLNWSQMLGLRPLRL